MGSDEIHCGVRLHPHVLGFSSGNENRALLSILLRVVLAVGISVPSFVVSQPQFIAEVGSQGNEGMHGDEIPHRPRQKQQQKSDDSEPWDDPAAHALPECKRGEGGQDRGVNEYRYRATRPSRCPLPVCASPKKSHQQDNQEKRGQARLPNPERFCRKGQGERADASGDPRSRFSKTAPRENDDKPDSQDGKENLQRDDGHQGRSTDAKEPEDSREEQGIAGGEKGRRHRSTPER